MKILGIGLSGLVGSRIEELLSSTYSFEKVSTSSGVDITKSDVIAQTIVSSDADYVLHLAAKTDVDGCEKDKTRDEEILALDDSQMQKKLWQQEKTAWAVNVIGTENIVAACKQTGKPLIYMSTDFVFDGKLPEGQSYTEEDIPDPLNWYARTKFEGEKRVQALSSPWIIMRISYPYRADYTKPDFVRAVLSRLEKGEGVRMIEDHIFCPTFIDDVAIALETLLTQQQQGIFHVVGNQQLTPYDAAYMIAKLFNCDPAQIEKTTRAVFFQNRAPRPFRLALNNAKIQQLSVRMRSFEEGLEEVKKQRVTV